MSSHHSPVLPRLTADSQDNRSRQGSVAPSPIIGSGGSPGPNRTGTASSLPPYSASPPRIQWVQDPPSQRAKTPSDILGMRKKSIGGRSGPELDKERFKFLVEPKGGENAAFHSPEASPLAMKPSKALMRLSEWDDNALKPLGSRTGTETEMAVGPPDSSKIFGSPPLSSRKTFRTPKRPSTSAGGQTRGLSLDLSKSWDTHQAISIPLDPTAPESAMNVLGNVKMCVYQILLPCSRRN